MSCETSRAAYHARRAAEPAVAAAFGGSAEATRALDEIFAVARAQAERQIAARSDDGGRIATLRALAEDRRAEQDTRALFAHMQECYGLKPPVHSASGVPRKDAQYGYAAIYRTLQAILAGTALPELARQIRAALLRRAQNIPSAPTPVAYALPVQQRGQALREGQPSAPVQLSSRSARQEYDHLLQVRTIKQRRLQHLQVKQAHLGSLCDPSILMEAEDLETELVALNSQVAAYAEVQTILSPLLSPEQQREALLALSAIIGLPPERIRLVDIVLGSIVLLVELPLHEAAHLLALQRLAPRALAGAGFASVAVAGENAPAALPLALAKAEALLALPQSEVAQRSLVTSGTPLVQLRVVLAEGRE